MIYLLLFIALIIAIPLLREALRKPMDHRARASAEGQFATLSQGTTHYQWLGPVRGPVAVCVHGLTTPSFVWRGLARGLALMGFRVLIYDLYGRGYSDRVPGPQDRMFFATQLSDLLADQGVTEDFVLVGYSMGGAIATVFTAANPERVRRLILLAPAGLGVRIGGLSEFIVRTPYIGDWLMLALYPGRHHSATDTERGQSDAVDAVVDLQQRELKFRGFTPAVLASMRGILTEVLQEEHQAIHAAGVPVLAVWGRDDSVIPLTAMGQLSDWSRNTQQSVIDGAGHGLPYTHTDQVLDAIRTALHDT